jgi:hypothetical protein
MLFLRNDPGRCPHCGYRVTPFADGCALCGTELDPHRRRRGPGLGQRLSSALTALSKGPKRGPRGPGSPSTPATYALMIVLALSACVIVSTVVGLVFWALGSLR